MEIEMKIGGANRTQTGYLVRFSPESGLKWITMN